jgi:hypothetical protein
MLARPNNDQIPLFHGEKTAKSAESGPSQPDYDLASD